MRIDEEALARRCGVVMSIGDVLALLLGKAESGKRKSESGERESGDAEGNHG